MKTDLHDLYLLLVLVIGCKIVNYHSTYFIINRHRPTLKNKQTCLGKISYIIEYYSMYNVILFEYID